MTGPAEVSVIGAGHAGLCAAAVLRGYGIPAVILERFERVGEAWRQRYHALRLNTERWGSHLPGLRIGPCAGRWPSGTEFADYLGDFAEHKRLDIRFGVQVQRIDVDPDGGYVLSTSQGSRRADAVVVATGPDHSPSTPSWPGLAGFPGTFLHSADYREAAAFTGERVLVVGGGESAADIAVDLATNGAGVVLMSVRSAPFIVRPDVLGVPAQAMAILARPQPQWLFDFNAELLRRSYVGDLGRYGLARPGSLHRSARVQGRAPILDRGFVRLVRAGRITIRPATIGMDGDCAQFADGTTAPVDAIIAATGYTPMLEPLVGHLGVLDADGRPTVHAAVTHPNAPHLYFAGFRPVLSGNIREAGLISRQIARALRRARRGKH